MDEKTEGERRTENKAHADGIDELIPGGRLWINTPAFVGALYTAPPRGPQRG